MQLQKEQEILMNVADMAIQIYCAESVLLRTEKLASMKGADATLVEQEMMKCFIYTAAEKINSAGKEALISFGEGDELKMMLMGLRRFTKVEPFNIKESRRVVAAQFIGK
jgi:hypothetical protein